MIEPVSGVVAPLAPGGRPVFWAATGRFGVVEDPGASRPPFDRLNLAAHVGDDAAAVSANRAALRTLIGAQHLVVMNAVHGAGVVSVTSPGDAPPGDALVCETPGLGIVALGADCLTVGIVGDDDRTVAVAHVGWRGLAFDVVGAALSSLAERGVSPAHVILGPSICGACYPVDDDRVDQIRSTCTERVAAAAVVPAHRDQLGIDVRAGVITRLAEWGIGATPVHVVDGCTREDASLFSFRRDGTTGRQGLAMVRAQNTDRLP